MIVIPKIPIEIWETILDLLQQQDLISFQNVCQEWHDVVIQYVLLIALMNNYFTK